MPELPEVETTRRGIAEHIVGRRITKVTVRERRLRYPIAANLAATLQGRTVAGVDRRGKYLLIACSGGTLIVHLGMSGSLRITAATTPVEKHDHVDLVLDGDMCLRFRDPRRFGAILWTARDPSKHKLLKNLGCEPLSDEFNGDYLRVRSRGRTITVKQYIMDGRVVVGVGNIYANEALFLANIHPQRSAARVARARYQILAATIKRVLGDAIKSGGTTLRDFVNGAGSPGYFQQCLRVYGRRDAPCLVCGHHIKLNRLGQRATYYCPHCQR